MTDDKPEGVYDWWRLRGVDVPPVQTEVAGFADWLAAVDDRFDSLLPACWLHHPWVVLMIDALRIEYDGFYRDGAGYPRGGVEFVIAVDTMIGKLAEWRGFDGHAADHDCSLPDRALSPARRARHRTEVGDGMDSHQPFSWPATAAAASRASLEAADDPRLREPEE